MRTFWISAGAIAVSAMLTASRAGAQPSNQDEMVQAGRSVYLAQCATCHGDAGTGYGPASWLLKKQPPDLTRLSNRRVPFPGPSVRNVITGRIRLEPSHHPSKMPVWRQSLNGELPGSRVTAIDALMAYLEDLQAAKVGDSISATPAMIAESGGRLFRTHCVACHGNDGRGSPSLVYTVGLSMNLTTITSRGGGVFDRRRVFESIARPHGDRDSVMPSWQRSFTRQGWSRYVTNKNIEALAAYIESIQQ